MKKLVLLFFLAWFGSHLAAHAQGKVSGEIVDGGDKTTKLGNANVMLVQAKDSILVDFVRANDNGKFALNLPDSLAYRIIITYPKYGEFFKDVKGATDQDLGQISMMSMAHLIEEVMVTGGIPVVIKGDTVEYDAKAFTVEKNAKVEDLLKVLPGISVDANGKITAQGKTVEKVLVDGEEFFGDDPTLVTRNIRSDMVDKVQLYEKKSEEAERTGVDDGVRTQTINVTLKEDAKKGMFGKVEGAGGNDDFYLGKLAINKFNGSQKIGAYVMGANDGNISLGWEDSEKFGMSNMESEMSDDGNMYFYYRGDDFDFWDGKGRPKALTGGVSFLDSWKESKHKLNGSYKYGIMQNDISESIITRNSLPNGDELNTESRSNKDTDGRKHRFNSRYDLKIDSLTTLTVNLSASKAKNKAEYDTEAFSTDANGRSVNENIRKQSDDNESSDFNYNGYLTRRFKKAGRSLSLRFGGNISDSEGTSFLNSKTDFYQNGLIDSIGITDQRKELESKSSSINASLNYSEPITKKISSTLGYEYSKSNAHSINNSYNKDENGNYADFDDVYSSDFDFNTQRNAVNFALRFKDEKFDVNFTNNFRNDDMFQRNNYDNLSLQRDFSTYNPRFYVRYSLSKTKGISLNYNRSNNLPSLSQIQPLRQNTDPLNEVIGNEDLTPAKTDSYNMSYNSYNMMKGRNFYMNVSFGQARNAIQQNVNIADDGVRTLFYENLDSHVSNNAGFWLGGGFDLVKKLQLKGRINGNGNYNNFYNYINGELNENTNYNFSLDFSVAKNTTKNIDFDLSFAPGWRFMETSLQSSSNSSGFVYRSNLWFKLKLPLKFALYGDASYEYEAATKALDEKLSIVLFKPGIQRKFLKDESLAVDFYVNDIFNQNKGFRRYQSGSSITQSKYNTIARYFMLKVSWDFTSFKGGKE